MTIKLTTSTQSSTTVSTTIPSTPETTQEERDLAVIKYTLTTITTTALPSTKTATIVPTAESISLTTEVVTTASVTSTTTTTTEEVFNFDVESSPSYNVVCYFNHTSYRRAKPMSFRTGHIPVPFCSHIIYASLGVNEDAELVPKDPVFDIEQGGFAKFAAIKKRHPKVSVMVAIGEDIGDSKAFLQISKYKQDAVALARNAASWLLDNRYDGLVVQWKMPASRPEDSATMGPYYKARLRMIVAASPGLTGLQNRDIRHGAQRRRTAPDVFRRPSAVTARR
ncbi:hypothetical protein HPB48_021582 [Haemaphysalis longicornis]|uniref:GH18 domain-containing protein n=1 Tax=Haemaphysalis longicornis TaxID=44386 RepID=A0A9J6H0R3_HAELO|nr:hypothetical protein HPB48_021582 [Haemaphysalis longicornis]